MTKPIEFEGIKPDLTAIRERCEKATPGPWEVVKGKSFGVQSENKNIASCFRNENEDFIAHSRQDIPALLAHIEHLEARVVELEDLQDDYHPADALDGEEVG